MCSPRSGAGLGSVSCLSPAKRSGETGTATRLAAARAAAGSCRARGSGDPRTRSARSLTGPQGTPAFSRRSSHAATEAPAKAAPSSGLEIALVLGAGGVVGKPGIVDQLGAPQHLAQGGRRADRCPPPPPPSRRQRVKNWKGVIAGCRGSEGPRDLPGHVVAGDGVLQEGPPGSRAWRGPDAGRARSLWARPRAARRPTAGEEGGAQIRRRRADADRRVAGQARDRGQPAHGLDDHVVRRPVGVGAALAEPGDRRVHQAGVARRDALVVEAEARHAAGAEVLHQDVGPLHEIDGQPGAAGRAQVEGHRTSCRGLTLAVVGARAAEEGSEVPRLVAASPAARP